MTTTRRILNEFVNEVTISVSQGVLREELDGGGIREVGPMVQCEITGPDSTSENMVTRIEASTLRDCLIEELWDPQGVVSPPATTFLGSIADQNRLEAILSRFEENSRLGHDMALRVIGAVIEAMDHAGVAFDWKTGPVQTLTMVAENVPIETLNLMVGGTMAAPSPHMKTTPRADQA